MLHIILKDLKSMMRRPVVFLLLLFGLIIGSASMIVYFTYGSEKLNNMDNMLIHGNSVAVSYTHLVAPIAQYSLLLPPVGVWTVSQFQCGRSPSQVGY